MGRNACIERTGPLFSLERPDFNEAFDVFQSKITPKARLWNSLLCLLIDSLCCVTGIRFPNFPNRGRALRVIDKRLLHASARVKSTENMALSIGDQNMCCLYVHSVQLNIYTIERSINFPTSSPITTHLQQSSPPKHSYQQHWQCCS